MISVAVALLVTGLPARGQTPAESPKVNLTLEQRHVIKEIVKDLNIRPAPSSVDTSVGGTVPSTIDLSRMPELVSDKVPQIKSHLFFVKDGKVVIVDPRENKIVEAID